jgi:hypothetical protein
MECEYCIGAGKVAMGKRLNNGKLSITIVRCKRCNGTGKKLTNADRIRAMSDEELAEWLCNVYDDDNCGVYQDECGKFINGTIIIDYDQYKLLEWLKQPVEEVEDDTT